MWNNPVPAPNCIIVYEDRGGYGNCQSFNGQGGKVYDSGSFDDIANDSISSLRIAANTMVVLCENADGSGASATFGPFSSQTDVDYVGDPMNDRTSRIEIYPRRAGSQWPPTAPAKLERPRGAKRRRRPAR